MAKNNVIDSLIMASQASSRIEGKSASRYSYFTIILFALISIGLLIALLFGTVIYKNVNTSRIQADRERSGIAVIANAIRYGDNVNAVKLGNGPEGRSLVIEESAPSGVYEVRFYLSDGEIVQEYSRQDSPYDPSKASKISDSKVFDASIDDGMVDITTDQGDISVALRTYQPLLSGTANG